MSFLETIAKAKTYLKEHGRVSLRALQREFGLDNEALDELVEELTEIQRVAQTWFEEDRQAIRNAGLWEAWYVLPNTA